MCKTENQNRRMIPTQTFKPMVRCRLRPARLAVRPSMRRDSLEEEILWKETRGTEISGKEDFGKETDNDGVERSGNMFSLASN